MKFRIVVFNEVVLNPKIQYKDRENKEINLKIYKQNQKQKVNQFYRIIKCH